MEKKQKIKVLHIIPTLDPGGAERLLVDIVEGSDKESFEITVVCFKRGGVWEEEIKRSGARLIILNKKSRFDFSTISKLRAIITSEAPDIVHTHLGGDIYGRYVAGRLQIPVISTEHNVNKDEGFLTRFFKRLTVGYAQKVICVSKAVAADAIKRYGLTPEQVAVIYNGIDLSRFRDAANPSNTIRIGSVGRLVPQKGFEYLIEAAAMLKTSLDIHFEIVGHGPLRAALQEKINTLGLQHKITLAGNRKDIPDFLASLDIFVLASRWEGLGIVILEAGTSCLPVIASRVDGIAEIIEDEVDGLLFTPGDAKELSLRIERCVSDRAFAKSLGVRLKEKIKRQFNISDMVKAYEALYQKYGK